MRYQGGKEKIHEDISRAILRNTKKRRIYIEPFVGGASVLFTIADNFYTAYASDINSALICMWKKVYSEGIDFLPDYISEEEWYKYKKECDDNPVKAFAGFACSFGAKYFGGYARSNGRYPDNYFSVSGKRGIQRKLDRNQRKNIKWNVTNYTEIANHFVSLQGSVIYCDPPYPNTAPYSGTPKFDGEKFVEEVYKWRDLGATVFVSGREFPFENVVWASRLHVTTMDNVGDNAKTNTEKLWMID